MHGCDRSPRPAPASRAPPRPRPPGSRRTRGHWRPPSGGHGQLVHSTPIVAAQKVANLFQAETGIKVELFRSGGSALRRFLQEIDAKRVLADVTVSDPAEVNALAKRDLLVPFRPKNFDKIPDAVKDPKGHHIAQRVNLAAIIMRTDKGLEAPKNWLDLTDPEVQGAPGHAGPSYTAIQLMVVGTLSQKYGWEFYQKRAPTTS